MAIRFSKEIALRITVSIFFNPFKRSTKVLKELLPIQKFSLKKSSELHGTWRFQNAP